MPQPNSDWQVISTWIGRNAAEAVQVSTFASSEQALQEVGRLAPHVGRVVEGRILKGVHISGDFAELWQRP